MGSLNVLHQLHELALLVSTEGIVHSSFFLLVDLKSSEIGTTSMSYLNHKLVADPFNLQVTQVENSSVAEQENIGRALAVQ